MLAIGYVVMRVSMVAMWLRVALQAVAVLLLVGGMVWKATSGG